MNILKISTADTGGGAERVAYALYRAYRERGHHASLVVGSKRIDDDGVISLRSDFTASRDRAPGQTVRTRVRNRYKGSALLKLARWCVHPRRSIEKWIGIEDFNYPASRRIMDLPPDPPDIIHCHNLHGGYFDLRALPSISCEAPTVLTLHDGWLMSGHCAHPLECVRWKTGCGHCPDLSLYPAIERDATAYNWRRKRQILRRSRLYVATPSEWLMRKVHESILGPAVLESRVIPNGVDLSLFRRGDRAAARTALNISPTSWVLLFVANGARQNVWKDYETMKRAVELVAAREKKQEILFVGLGEDGRSERMGNVELRFIPFERNATDVVPYYQASDLYLHAARADTFPTTVLEALACGTPIVATAVGGIPEQVKGLSIRDVNDASHLNLFESAQATGVLTPPSDAESMARWIQILLKNDSLRHRLADNAARDARARFDIAQQIDRYLDWYERILRTTVGRRAAS